MTAEDTQQGDDGLTLWIGAVMLLIIAVLSVLWVQQTRRLQQSQRRCQQLEAAIKMKMDPGAMFAPEQGITDAQLREMGLEPGEIRIVDDESSTPTP